MMPEAPVRFSTMNCCLSEAESFAANRRASGSTEPPGGYGETNLTSRAGHSCARAGNERSRRRTSLKSHIPRSFQLEHLARVARRSDGEAELLENPPRLRDLGSIRFGELPAAKPQAVLEADAHVAAHHRRHRGDKHLVAAGAHDRPVVSVAEQTVGGALHVEHGLGMRADAAADAEHRLEEQRRLEQPPLEEVRRGVEMADVVALDLEASVVVGAGLQDVGDVLEAVLEDALVAALEVGLFPDGRESL